MNLVQTIEGRQRVLVVGIDGAHRLEGLYGALALAKLPLEHVGDAQAKIARRRQIGRQLGLVLEHLDDLGPAAHAPIQTRQRLARRDDLIAGVELTTGALEPRVRRLE